jgi:hypothetical protein
MRLDVVDAVCEPAGLVNEDRWGGLDRAAWVIDGATGIAEERVLPGPSDAFWLVERVDAGLRQRAALPMAPAEVLRPIVRGLQQEFARVALRPRARSDDLPGGSLALLRLFGNGVEFSSLGDCRIVHANAEGSTHVFGTSKVTALDNRLVDEVVRLQAEGLPHPYMGAVKGERVVETSL